VCQPTWLARLSARPPARKPPWRPRQGRIVNVGRLGGTNVDFNVDLHAARRINQIGHD